MYNSDITSGQTSSLWSTGSSNNYSPLSCDLQTEVCIVGAGIAGISLAYQLVKSGKTVVVIDDGYVGSGETGRTTAHLSNALDDRYFEIERIHGQGNAILAAQSHTEAINFIEAVVQQENIACDFKRLNGYLFLAPEQTKDLLVKEQLAAHRAGLNEVQLIDNPNLTGIQLGSCLHFPKQAQFHPLQYLNRLAQAFIRQGGKLYTQTAARDFTLGQLIQIKTDKGYTIKANHAVIATNTPIFDKTFSFAKQTPYRSYVIAGKVPKNSIEQALYWDTAEPYHYVRLQPDNDDYDTLIIGGEDHHTGERPKTEPFSQLESWARFHFPQLLTIDQKWSGQILEPTDHLAYLGRLPSKEKNLYIITGDSGNGMTHGTLAAILITDLILGHANPWEQLYSPTRSLCKNIKELAKHNLNSASYYFEYFTPGEVNSTDQIKCGQGAIIRKGLSKRAVYRDENNQLHEYSAVCPHLQALIKWNPIEKSWDCAAHGSRFAPCGQVLQGPAAKPLTS